MMNGMMCSETQFSKEVSFNTIWSWRVTFYVAFGFCGFINLENDLNFVVKLLSFFNVIQGFEHVVDSVTGLNSTCLNWCTSCSRIIIHFIITLYWILLQNEFWKMIEWMTHMLPNRPSELRILGAVNIRSLFYNRSKSKKLLDPLIVGDLASICFLLCFLYINGLDDAIVLQENLSSLFKNKGGVLRWHSY